MVGTDGTTRTTVDLIIKGKAPEDAAPITVKDPCTGTVGWLGGAVTGSLMEWWRGVGSFTVMLPGSVPFTYTVMSSPCSVYHEIKISLADLQRLLNSGEGSTLGLEDVRTRLSDDFGTGGLSSP